MNSSPSSSRRHLLGLALGTAAASLLAPVKAVQAQPARVPDPFFELSFNDLDGKPEAMRDFLGKPLVLNFWATWCPPCVKEMPDLDALNRQHPDVAFLGLAVDTEVNVRKFLEKIQVDYPLLLTGHGGIRLMRELGNRQGGLPFTLLFDGRGRIVQRILGQIKPEVLDGYIRDLPLS